MILGKPSHFEKEHYEAQRGVASAELCELVVHCLELVSHLAHQGLAFRFKGGNSLLVLLDEPQRFSIDVDIVTTVAKDELTAMVDRIVSTSTVFTRWESRQPKTKPWLPLISYKLFFRSAYPVAEEPYVMLDAVLEPPPYPGVRKRVRCGSIYESTHDVELPSVSGLIGDKLLAIGPSTLGIPLGKGKAAQRLKHVFDVARLSREPHGALAVRDSIVACQAQEERIQGRRFDWSDIASDTARFCRAPIEHDRRPDPAGLEPSTYLYEIALGFDDFRKHLFRKEYAWSDFRADCERVLSVLDALG